MKAKVFHGSVILTDDEGEPLPPGTEFKEEFRAPLTLPSKEQFFADAFADAFALTKDKAKATFAAHSAIFLAPSFLHMLWEAVK